MRLLLWTIATSLLLATGCTQDTSSETFGLIHEGATLSTELVLAEGFDAPTLESALAPGLASTPIEIEVAGELAIAWRRYDEVPELRRESDVIALWRVVERVPVAATEAPAPVALSGQDLELEGTDFDYFLVDLDNRMELGEQFDPELWELWQLFVESHAVCP
ncbi:MAG: hypothetical protein AB8H86_09870 [Polyangiales bacterium]